MVAGSVFSPLSVLHKFLSLLRPADIAKYLKAHGNLLTHLIFQVILPDPDFNLSCQLFRAVQAFVACDNRSYLLLETRPRGLKTYQGQVQQPY